MNEPTGINQATLPMASRSTDCHGTPPLPGKPMPWLNGLLDRPSELTRWMREHGSPLNVLRPDQLSENVVRLRRQASELGLNLDIFFARKANKCLSMIDAAVDAGAGIDTASGPEVEQTLGAGVDPRRIVCTAAIKNDDLIKRCLDTGVLIVVDNIQELSAIESRRAGDNRRVDIAIRVSGFRHDDEKLPSRFGFDVDDLEELFDRCDDRGVCNIAGLQFHLNGYDANHRRAGLADCLSRVPGLRSRGHDVRFIDIGGGFPMVYGRSSQEAERFWEAHERSLISDTPPITWQRHRLGRQSDGRRVWGRPNVYPYWQSPIGPAWLREVLNGSIDGEPMLRRIESLDLTIRCEPGRALMDACGATIATVEFVKRSAAGDDLIGLAMNSTQCRTTFDDFLVDPIVVRMGSPGRPRTGYLVGAYCTESELLTWRRLQFPRGVEPGDLIAFPNTAGYLMHFRESRSHQFPLAKNLILGPDGPCLDAIDASA